MVTVGGLLEAFVPNILNRRCYERKSRSVAATASSSPPSRIQLVPDLNGPDILVLDLL
jgi:hypothetical protein